MQNTAASSIYKEAYEQARSSETPQFSQRCRTVLAKEVKLDEQKLKEQTKQFDSANKQLHNFQGNDQANVNNVFTQIYVRRRFLSDDTIELL